MNCSLTRTSNLVCIVSSLTPKPTGRLKVARHSTKLPKWVVILYKRNLLEVLISKVFLSRSLGLAKRLQRRLKGIRCFCWKIKSRNFNQARDWALSTFLILRGYIFKLCPSVFRNDVRNVFSSILVGVQLQKTTPQVFLWDYIACPIVIRASEFTYECVNWTLIFSKYHHWKTNWIHFWTLIKCFNLAKHTTQMHLSMNRRRVFEVGLRHKGTESFTTQFKWYKDYMRFDMNTITESVMFVTDFMIAGGVWGTCWRTSALHSGPVTEPLLLHHNSCSGERTGLNTHNMPSTHITRISHTTIRLSGHHAEHIQTRKRWLSL